MKRVVIVEDEKLVLLGIESLFATNSRYRIVGSFSRAASALTEIPTLDPDIIVTDIKMPGMDGLEFLQYLNEHHVRAKIVILSCLDDFSIVSKAFKLGAVDYILKHELDEKELFRTLDGLDIAPASVTGLSGLKEPWNELRRFSERVAQGEQLAGDIENPLVCLLVCKKRYSDDHVPLKTGVDTVWIMRFIQRLIAQFGLGTVFYEDSGSLVLVVDASEEKHSRRQDFFNQLILQLKQYINSPVVILRGTDGRPDSLDRQWAYLVGIRDVAFYIESTRISIGKRDSLATPSSAKELPNPILLLQPDGLTVWKREMDGFFNHARDIYFDVPRLCTSLIVYWHQVCQLVKTVYGDFAVEMFADPSVFEYLKEFDDFSQLQQWYVLELPKNIGRIHQVSGHSRKIMKMKLYALEHFNEHISLQSMAERLHVNSNYLCSLFKRESKTGFIEYLNTIRVEKAKALLLESDDTVENISLQVGFISSSHFSKIFKRIAGQTVSEYRINHPCKPNIEHGI